MLSRHSNKLTFLILFICANIKSSAISVDSILVNVHSLADSTILIKATDAALASVKADRTHAIQVAEVCINASRAVKFRKGEAMAHYVLGKVYIRNGSYDKSVSNFLQALKIFEELGLKQQIITVYVEIAGVHTLLKDYQTALSYAFRASKELDFSETQMAQQTVDVNNLIGMAYCELNRLDSAVLYLEAARKMAVDNTYQAGEATSIMYLSKASRAKGNILYATDLIQKAIELARAQNDTSVWVNALNASALIYIETGEYKDAAIHLKLAEGLARKTGEIQLIIDAQRVWLSYYKKVKDYQNAIKVMEELDRYRDTVSDVVANEKIQELETLYKLEMKEKEFNRLRRENTLNEINLLNVKLQQKTTMVIVFFLLLMAGTIVYSLFKQNKINARLVELNEEKNNIMAILSHDLKAPLTKLHTLIQLTDHAMEKGRQEYIKRMKEVIHEGSEMIQNLLDVTYIEERTPNVNISEIDICETFLVLIDEHRPSAERKQIKINFVSALEELVFHTDYQKFKRIMDNVLSNGVKYTNVGKQVDIHVSDYRDGIFVKIKDEGQGMDKEDMSKLFTKFSRLKSTPTGGESSTGMGLYIVKNLCELLGGEVSCESSPGAGTTFAIYLPSMRLPR